MDHQASTSSGLPDNAYKELKPGEEYRPIMDPVAGQREITPWSVGWGLVMAVLFSAAAAYSGLKIGQVFEAAIPIAILAVGLSAAFGKKNALGQNVIIQSIGASSGVIVAGAIFTIPALYILDLPASFFQVFLASLLGGFLGILFLIPFRKYFVKDMHGKFPFPEATATTEILIAGEKGGKQAVLDFWNYLSDTYLTTLKEFVAKNGIRGCWMYWSQTLNEEAADFTMELDEDAGEFRIIMHHCPSKGRLLELDQIDPYEDYCRHCDVLYRRVLEPLGYEYTVDLTETHKARCSVTVRVGPK